MSITAYSTFDSKVNEVGSLILTERPVEFKPENFIVCSRVSNLLKNSTPSFSSKVNKQCSKVNKVDVAQYQLFSIGSDRGSGNSLANATWIFGEKEVIFIAGDSIKHVGSSTKYYEDQYGGYGFGVQNKKEKVIFATMYMTAGNAYFEKKESHQVTYKNVGR